MTPDSAAIRDELLTEIRRRRLEFQAAGDAAERDRTLPAGAVATLASLGLFWLKTPAELGGTPLGPLDFCDVMEELSYADTSTAWTAMVGNGGSGTAGGWLPDEGARQVFSPQRPLPLVVGTPGPRGAGRVVPGGYIVHGRWGFASGIAQADWVIGGFRVPAGPAGGADRLMVAIVPRDQARVIDNWHVAGLRGTGSFDFELDDVFVPAERTFERAATACRGGALFHQEAHVFLSNELPPLAIGIARRAVEEMAALAAGVTRYAAGPVLAERAVFHKELGRAEVRLNAARLAHREAVARAYDAAARSASAGGTRDAAAGGGASARELEGAHLAVAATSVYAVETCVGIVSDLFRYGGGRVLSLGTPMQRHLRDLLATRQHIGLSEENYERAGRFRLSPRG